MKNTKKLLTSFVLMVTASQSFAYSFVGRWFEVEVILLSQLGDKANIKEAFTTNKALPDYNRHIDILASYLSPDIESLKNNMPQCGERGWLLDTYQESLAPKPYFVVKTLEEIELERLAKLTFDDVAGSPLSDDAIDDELARSQPTGRDMPVVESDIQTDEVVSQAITDAASEAEPELTAEQISYLAQAKEAFSEYKFNLLDDLYYDELCVLSPKKYLSIVSDNLAEYNTVIHHNMQRIVDGAPFENSEIPYLLDQDAFQLKDIYKQLRRSREFRPLLHVAWRQPVYRLNQAIPVRLYAGEHLEQTYQDQQSLYLKQQALLAEQESTIEALVNSEDNTLAETESINQVKEIRKSKLLNIIENADAFPEDINDLLAKTEQDKQLYQTLLSQTEQIYDGPTQPIQPWYLDGFFRLHLHRNYLNITADFNILSKTLANYENDALLPDTHETVFETINFDQKRRIITKEIHYFDHPHMGMIVQVRRYNRPKPEVE
jgi:hypothetical protein